MIEFHILTIFPEIIECYTRFGIVKQAIKKGLVRVNAVDIRNFAKKGQVDDEAYGGVPGMVLKPEPIFEAFESLALKNKPFVLLTEPWGEKITQPLLDELSRKENIVIICGRYEGVDERVKTLVDMEVSLGDFILSGGELVALSVVDGVSRLIEGVLGDPKSLEEDSFSGRWLGYPVYTRPREYKGMSVPEELLSGNHKLIQLWTLWHRIGSTLRKRPNMIPEDLEPLEREILESIRAGKSFRDWIKDKF